MLRYIIYFILLTSIGMIYDRYKRKYMPSDEERKNALIKHYLLNDSILGSNKPIMWIHTRQNVNARHWQSFHGRNSKMLNQPYIEACVESIVKKCGKSFNVCLIDNDSFSKLIPEWNVDINLLADPVKSHMEKLGLVKLLNIYGGMIIPNSTIVLHDLSELFSNALSEHDAFVVEGLNRSETSAISLYSPSDKIMGASKNSKQIEKYTSYLEGLVGSDFTSTMDFEGSCNRWLHKETIENRMKLINGKIFGIRNMEEQPVYVDNLLSNSFVKFSPHMKALYLPADEILSRVKYNWFARMSKKQVMESKTVAGKHLIISHGSH